MVVEAPLATSSDNPLEVELAWFCRCVWLPSTVSDVVSRVNTESTTVSPLALEMATLGAVLVPDALFAVPVGVVWSTPV